MTFSPVLWWAARTAAGDPRALRDLARSATAEQLVLLVRRAREAAAQLPASPRVAAWAVTQGEKVWKDARRDPSTLPREAPPGAWDMAEVLAEVYRQRFGTAIPDQEPAPTGEAALRFDPAWENALWELIDVLGVGVPLEQALAGYTRSELVKLIVAAREVVDRLSEEAEQRFGEDPQRTGWMLWAEQALGRGKDAVEAMLADPPRASHALPEDAPLLREALAAVYRSRYGEPPP